MATGYTHEFADKDVSFNEFVWKCARAMGSFIHMRDDPMSSEIRMPEEDTYHSKSLLEAVEYLEELKNMPLTKAFLLMTEEREASIKRAKESLEKSARLRERYTKMIAKVSDWQPPTPEHTNFKKFMLEQLTSSLDWDCNDKYTLEELARPEITAQEWLDREIKSATRDVEYHTQHMSDDKKRNKEVIDWIKALQQSVPLPK
jgi:hypothetical protein